MKKIDLIDKKEMELEMFHLLKEWRTAVNERVTMKPESEYIHWFISLIEKTNEIINECEEKEIEEQI